MSVDQATVRRIAHLSRIALDEAEVETMRGELNAILAFVEELNEVDVSSVEPMSSVASMRLPMRRDVVSEGGDPAPVLLNAPVSEDGFFLVPKVVE